MIPYSDASIHHRTFPVVNTALIGISVLVFLIEIRLGGFGTLTGNGGINLDIFFFKWGFISSELTSGKAFDSLNTGFQVVNIATPVPTEATIFTSMFIHGGVMHLAGNMMFLWVFGDNLEDRLGHVKYLLFYLLVGVAATLSQWAIDTGSQVPLIGASGAISGVLGAYLMIYPFNRIKALIIFYLITVVEMRAMWLLGAWFAWQLIQGGLSLGMANSVSVAFFAHIGGFAAGVVLAGLYKLAIGEPLIPGSSSGGGSPWDHWYQTGRSRD
ncbi:MAG: rhomboid family intramembrane serine protease [Chloroflexi bacterium]|nr:rhomboid family intramembrane serine protease [Chloroflexota bacterium]MDA1270060.1 rhomboid family intramembrane serine protease [Chloroflexota bacterium]PKB58756.1 MAG: hypothetical protein BZY83_05420 [SAR202 cluster bacterium Casp-Chloro-G2]